MPRVCTVCSHPDRPAVDQALINHKPYRDIAGRFSLGKNALLRHHDDHLPQTLAQAKAAEEAAQADDLLTELKSLRDRTYTLLEQAEKAGDIKAALAAIREVRATLELLGEMAGKLDRKPTVNLLLAPEWLAVRAALLTALLAYPEARAAVAERLLALEAGNGHSG